MPAKAAQILAAAKEVFLQQGFGAASMDAIARTAGVSKATLYAHFQGKEELFARVVSGEWASHWKQETEPEAPADDPRAALESFGRRFVALLLHPEALAIYRITVGEAVRFPELGRLFFEGGPATVRRRLTAYLAAAASAGRLRVPDPALAAEQFLGMMQTPLHLRSLLDIGEGTGPREQARIIAAAVETFLAAHRT
ncbi:MAG TPA: TetR/AcrR family transcriptional regulator [Azospirillaceae bacterium]|nr:TetR/AcrR family transcriptional regulator [Azospirillaceae bacterium]